MTRPIIQEGDEIVLPAPYDNVRALFKSYRHDLDGSPVLFYTSETGEPAEIRGVPLCAIGVNEKPSIPIKFTIGDYAYFIDAGVRTDTPFQQKPSIVHAKVEKVKVLTQNGEFSVWYDFGSRFKMVEECDAFGSINELVEHATRDTSGNS